MPNDTVVQYILNVDSKTAERGLDRTAKEAKETSEQFDHLGQSSIRASNSLRQTAKQTDFTTKKVRQLRRAGRDLDGALMDLGQGVSLLSPALGRLVINLSDAASIAEGIGRIGTLLLNPAFLATAGIVTTLGLGFVAFNEQQEKAKEEAEKLSKATDQANKVLLEQEKAIDTANERLSKYVTLIENARLDLSLLTGELSNYEFQQKKATDRANEFNLSQTKDRQKLLDALFKEIQAAQTLVDVAKQKRKNALEELSSKELENALNNETIIFLDNAVKKAEEKRDALVANFKLEKQATEEIAKQSKEFEKVLLNIEKIKQQNKNQAEEKKKQQEDEKQRQKEINETNKRLGEIQAARNQLLLIGEKTTEATLTEEQKITKQFNEQIALVNQLAITSEDLALGNEIALALENEKIRLLGLVNDKEEERVDILKDQAREAQNVFDILNSSIQALQSPEAFVGGLGGILGGVAEVGGFAGLGAAAPAVSAAGTALGGIAGLGGSVQAEIDRSIAEARSQAEDQARFDRDLARGIVPDLVLDENQAEKVVLGNMQKAFDQFLTDLERGLEILPEILVKVLPEFTASLVKVIQVDMVRLLAVDLPIAIVQGFILAIPALINELGFLFADVVNSIKFFFDELRAFLQGDFQRRTKEERKEDRKTFLEDTFPGIQAAIQSVRQFAGGGRFVPYAAGGMRFTGSSREGLAMLHQNEFVVPASGQRPQTVDRTMSTMGGGVNITVNGTVVEQNAIDALVRKIEERFNSNYGIASSNLFGGR